MSIRVLIVDDSALMRRALTSLLASDPEIEVVGTARDGQQAIEQVALLRPDVITMDVRMPVLDGLQTTEHIMAYYPTPILVLTASLSRFDIDITFRMLGLGALDVMEKPSGSDPNGLQQARAELIRRVKVLSRVRVVTHLRGRRRADEASVEQSKPRRPRGSQILAAPDGVRRGRGSRLLTLPAPARVASVPPVVSAPPRQTAFGAAERLVVIGASTGGPRVVQQILRELPPTFPAAVLVVQHIADGFTRGMVEWLGHACHVPIHLAQGGDVALPGHVYVAPDDLHLLIDGDGVLSVSSQPAIIQRPAVDVTMQRAAATYGARSIGVLLTGMGRDGAVGMAAIHQSGGYTIAQSGETCVVFGMPRAAIEARVVHEVLSPDAIVGRLLVLLRDGMTKERR